jgi:hypothetical protein
MASHPAAAQGDVALVAQVRDLSQAAARHESTRVVQLELVLIVWQPTPAAALKRSRATSPGVEPQPQPLPAWAVPPAVWEDHLLPRLTGKDAARLGRTCKALRGMVRAHFQGDLGHVQLQRLRDALTTFPRARSTELCYGNRVPRVPWGNAREEALIEWLREGGRGAGLTTVGATGLCDVSMGAESFVHAALRAGALPSLRSLAVHLKYPDHRASLTGGFLRGVHELRLEVVCIDEVAPQLAALSLVRHLPDLATLNLTVIRDPDAQQDPEPWPPFTPPSLTTLRIGFGGNFLSDSLLGALPGTIEASGATLERLELPVGAYVYQVGDALIHVAQAVRCCSATLKDFRLSTSLGTLGLEGGEEEDGDGEVERLRVDWADLLAGVSACRELEVLVLPHTEFGAVFPPGTAFPRLTHLEITAPETSSDHVREHPPGAGGVGLWELMASGGLPALAKLRVSPEGALGRRGEVRGRVAPAFEAVAGTLTHLSIEIEVGAVGWGDEGEAGYEWGLAVGKLRRLKELALGLSTDGRAYYAFARGLAASGGDRPPPLLRRIKVAYLMRTNADLLASLLLPSVRVFDSCYSGHRPALLTACALRQAGYKHTWALDCKDGPTIVRMVAQCMAADVDMEDWQ